MAEIGPRTKKKKNSTQMADTGPVTKERGGINSMADNMTISHSLHTTTQTIRKQNQNIKFQINK